MDAFTEKIHKQYLIEEINKMQKTAKSLKKMMVETDPIKDDDLIVVLHRLHLNAIENIKSKKRELKNLYNIDLEINNN